MSWESTEPGFSFARREAARLIRRSRHRLAWVLILSFVIAGGYTTKRLIAPKKYEAQITFRIVEADFDLTSAVRPPREYLDYVWGVFLSAPNLLKVIQRYDLYPDKVAQGSQLAVEALRAELDVKVWRNYFMEEHYGDDPEARSARVSITWTFKDPQIVLEVVKALGETIIEAQMEDRRQVFATAQQDVAEATDSGVDRLEDTHRAIVETRRALELARGSRRTALAIQLGNLELDDKVLSKRVEEMSSTQTRFEITAAWERQRSGIRFELVDPGFVLPPKGGGRLTIALVGIGVLFVAMFLVSLLVGAFEVKIRQADDVRRLGLNVLGAVPTFVGDRVGTLAERLRAEDALK